MSWIFWGFLIYRSLTWAKDLEKTRFRWKVSVKFTQELCFMWNNVIWTGLYIPVRYVIGFLTTTSTSIIVVDMVHIMIARHRHCESDKKVVHLFLARLSDSIYHNKFTHTEMCDCMSTKTYTKCNAPIWHVTIDRFDLQNWSLNTWYIIISTQTFVTCCWLDTLKCVYSFTINDVCVIVFSMLFKAAENWTCATQLY